MKFKLRGVALGTINWPPILFYGVLVLGLGGLLWWQLGTLAGSYSVQEWQSLQDSISLKHILEHPLNAPFTLLVYGLLKLGGDSLLIVRLVSVAFGLLTLSVFYWLVKYWHGERSAVFGTLIFGTSAWFLHTARLGTPAVLLFMLLALAACGVWIKHNKGILPLLVSFVLAASLLYVPGMIWFIGLGVLWQWKRIDRIFKRNLWIVSLGALLVLAALAPLAWAIYQDPAVAKQLAGLPAQGWPDPFVALRALADVPLNLFWRGPADPAIWLGRLPLLDAFSMAMFGLGVYLYCKHWRLQRTKLLAAILVMGPCIISLGGSVGLSLIVPFVYILVAAGTGFMLDYWRSVFPRNVIAQVVGTGLISFAVIVTCFYHLRHYYIAWPGAPATRAVFVIPSSVPSVKIEE